MEYRRLLDCASSVVSQLMRAISKDFNCSAELDCNAGVVFDTTTLEDTFKVAKLIEGFAEFATKVAVVMWILP